MYWNGETTLKFGKHRGKLTKEAPAEYLIFLFENNCCPPGLAHYIGRNIDFIRDRAKKEAREEQIRKQMKPGKLVKTADDEYAIYYLTDVTEDRKAPIYILSDDGKISDKKRMESVDGLKLAGYITGIPGTNNFSVPGNPSDGDSEALIP